MTEPVYEWQSPQEYVGLQDFSQGISTALPGDAKNWTWEFLHARQMPSHKASLSLPMYTSATWTRIGFCGGWCHVFSEDPAQSLPFQTICSMSIHLDLFARGLDDVVSSKCCPTLSIFTSLFLLQNARSFGEVGSFHKSVKSAWSFPWCHWIPPQNSGCLEMPCVNRNGVSCYVY